MAIGVVNDEDFNAELNRLTNPSSPQKGEIKDIPKPGRKPGDTNVPDFLRKLIGESAVEDGNKEAKGLAKQFGISDSSVSAYKNGATSTASYNSPDKELAGHITDTKIKITGKAKSRILRAIANITDEKLEATKPVDLSTIARNLSAVVKQMEPDVPQASHSNGPTFVFYAPPQKKEESFDMIVLKE